MAEQDVGFVPDDEDGELVRREIFLRHALHIGGGHGGDIRAVTLPILRVGGEAAGEFIAKNPEESATLIAPKSTSADQAALVSLIKANDRLGMSVVGANDVRKQIEAVYKAGIDVGYLKMQPSGATVYNKALK